jgi:hypothetical protein
MIPVFVFKGEKYYLWHNANSIQKGLRSKGVATEPTSNWTPVM